MPNKAVTAATAIKSFFILFSSGATSSDGKDLCGYQPPGHVMLESRIDRYVQPSSSWSVLFQADSSHG
jgi:hypothetical protein